MAKKAKQPKDDLTRLAEAFLLFAEEGMDSLDEIEKVWCGIYDPQEAAELRRLLESKTEALR